MSWCRQEAHIHPFAGPGANATTRTKGSCAHTHKQTYMRLRCCFEETEATSATASGRMGILKTEFYKDARTECRAAHGRCCNILRLAPFTAESLVMMWPRQPGPGDVVPSAGQFEGRKIPKSNLSHQAVPCGRQPAENHSLNDTGRKQSPENQLTYLPAKTHQRVSCHNPNEALFSQGHAASSRLPIAKGTPEKAGPHSRPNLESDNLFGREQ